MYGREQTPDSYGSMLELSWKGTKPMTLEGAADGGERRFLKVSCALIFSVAPSPCASSNAPFDD